MPQDKPGTDSDLLARSGALWSGLAGTAGFQILGDAPPWWELVQWLSERGGLDLILVEGGKSAPFAKVEVVRGGEAMCPDAAGRLEGEDPVAWTQWLLSSGLLHDP